jgi:hypothetical protein
MSMQSRREAVDQAIAEADRTDGSQRTLFAIRNLLDHLATAVDDSVADRRRWAEAVEVLMNAEDPRCRQQPLGALLRRVIREFRYGD